MRDRKIEFASNNLSNATSDLVDATIKRDELAAELEKVNARLEIAKSHYLTRKAELQQLLFEDKTS